MATHNTIFREAVMLRTYCRDLPDGSRRESPEEVWERVLDAFSNYYAKQIRNLPSYFDERDWKSEWRERMSKGKALPAGRMLWSMGSRSIEEEGFLPMMNCAFVTLDHPVDSLRFLMKMLMLGCGVGFSLERKHFKKLQKIFIDMRYPMLETGYGMIRDDKNKEYRSYVVEDSRQGWISFICETVERAIRMQKFRYSLAAIRPKGSVIKGFGGRSGDPTILGNIAERIYKMMTSSAAPTIKVYYDVICSIGELVVSGNIRRSALIAIGDPQDEEFLNLKRFSVLSDYPWRAYCNNSVNVSSFDQLNDSYWSTYNGDSEAYGWVNIEKCIESDKRRNPNTHRMYILPEGFNPCGEQPLANREVCCLGEVNMCRAESEEDLFQSLLMCYFFCKFAFTLGAPTENRTDGICRTNNRIGISLTGIAMVNPEKLSWLKNCRQMLHHFDSTVSLTLKLSESIALTTVKPGGTLPKIAGSAGPGIHRPISEYQIRRVRFRKNSKILKWLESLGVPVEPQFGFDGTPDPAGTQVASFYLKNEIPYDEKYSDWQMSKQGFRGTLDLITRIQNEWSDNAISVTVYYNKEEMQWIKNTLEMYFDDFKVFSGLPYEGHNFLQAPEEPISEKSYTDFFKSRSTEVLLNKSYLALEPDSDGDETPEDFGQCEARGSCSDR